MDTILTLFCQKTQLSMKASADTVCDVNQITVRNQSFHRNLTAQASNKIEFGISTSTQSIYVHISRVFVQH